jgi:hypothetical protein
VDSLVKPAAGGDQGRTGRPHAVHWTDRITVRRGTGRASHKLFYNY